jgi:hypothetical protein
MESAVDVCARDDFHLELKFDAGETRLFDAWPCLERGVLRRLRDPQFQLLEILLGGQLRGASGQRLGKRLCFRFCLREWHPRILQALNELQGIDGDAGRRNGVAGWRPPECQP